MKDQWPADNVERRAVASLVPYARNARTHSAEQVDQIAASIREWGWTTPVLLDEESGIIAGHGRVLAARKLGIVDVPVMVARGWSEAQKRAYVLADNKLALNAGWDADLLAVELGDLQGLDFDLALTGFSPDEIADLTIDRTEGATDPDETPEKPSEPVSGIGDVWLMGRHRLLCASSTDAVALKHFGKPDLVMTDPPYCSGGFQEAGRAAGSTTAVKNGKAIANDRLSSRGFGALIKDAVFNIPAHFFYVFTDWRMWVYLFDVAESSGAGVRSMITWNKGTPGMGTGWRSQHELVMWAARSTPPYAKGFPGVGNVISISRQKNDLHTTQKPVEVMRVLLQGAPFARTVAEPFAGSGTTLIACEMDGRSCAACELDPAYVDVAVTRWQNFAEQVATLEETGESFAEVMARRKPVGVVVKVAAE